MKLPLFATFALGAVIGLPNSLSAQIVSFHQGNYISHAENDDTGLPGFNRFQDAFNAADSFASTVRTGVIGQQDVRGNRDPVIMFKLFDGTSINLASVLIGVNGNIGTAFDLTLRIYSQADVTTGTWTPGSLLRTEVFSVPATSFAGPDRSTMELQLSAPLMLDATTGTAGYALQIDVPGTDTLFRWALGSAPYTNFEEYRYYRADIGNYGQPNPASYQQFGLVAIPEPSTVAAVIGLFALLLVFIRRRLRA